MLMARPNVTGRELTIAGAIILVAGVAIAITVPIFNQNHRNSERIRDMNLIADALVSYQEDNGGDLPDSDEIATLPDLADLGDPDGNAYTYLLNGRSDDAVAQTLTLKRETLLDHKVYIYYSATCSGNFPTPVGNHQKFAVFYKLEGGSSVYCTDNGTQ